MSDRSDVMDQEVNAMGDHEGKGDHRHDEDNRHAPNSRIYQRSHQPAGQGDPGGGSEA